MKLTEGWQRPSYCWATPSSLSGCQGKILSSNVNTDPRRRRGVYVVRTKMASGSTSTENDEEYQQFKSMLGDAPSSSPQTLDAKRDAYSDFADMLGLDGGDPEQVDSKKSVAKLSPKKVEIDPADYSLFDAMLERTGGTGTKPNKGGKRYTRTLTNNKKKGAKREIIERVVESQPRNSVDGREESTRNASAQHSLTAEEKAQAYAVMMEEFGPGVHGAVETLSPDEDVDELDPQSTELLEAPERPGVSRQAEAAGESETITSEANVTYNDTTDEADSLTLEPKPSRPIHDDQSSLNETTGHALLQDDTDVADASPTSPFPSRPSEKGPLSQSLEDQSQRNEDEPALKTDETKAEIQPELNPPPTRPSGDDEIGKHQTLTEEPQLRGPVFSTREENFEGRSPVALLKPKNRPDPVTGSTVSSDFQLDGETGPPRPFPRTRSSRNQRSKDDERVQVLKNPKLIYKINE